MWDKDSTLNMQHSIVKQTFLPEHVTLYSEEKFPPWTCNTLVKQRFHPEYVTLYSEAKIPPWTGNTL